MNTENETIFLVGGPLDAQGIDVNWPSDGSVPSIHRHDQWLLQFDKKRDTLKGLFPASRGVMNPSRRVVYYRSGGSRFVFRPECDVFT